MKNIHRWVGAIAALLLAFIALAGVAIQAEQMLNKEPRPPDAKPPTQAAKETVSKNAFTDQRIGEYLARALAAAHLASPGSPVLDIELRKRGESALARVTVASPEPQRLSFDADSGEAAKPPPGPRDLRLTLIRLHRGDWFGVTGTVISVLCGVALTTIAFTGLWVYVQMFRRRLQLGRYGVFWK